MSITSKLYIDDDEFTILQYHWSFHQNSDITGRPSARTTGGLITVLIETQKKDPFTEWALTKEMMKNVKIVQSPTVRISKSRVLEFYDVYCLEASDSFNGVNNRPMTTTLVLSPGIIVVNGQTLLEKSWKVTDLSSNIATVRESDEPRLLGYSFEDEEGEPIKKEKLKHNQIFYLIIESENADGETTSINLDDDRLDFKYDGRIAKNDILRGVPLTGDETRVELMAVRQKQQQNG